MIAPVIGTHANAPAGDAATASPGGSETRGEMRSMMARTDKTTDPTDNASPEWEEDCCTNKRSGLMALVPAGALPFLIAAGPAAPSTAPSAPASPGLPKPSVGAAFDLLGNVVNALPGHWLTAGGLAVGGAWLGFMHLKQQAGSGKARALPLPKGTNFASQREVGEFLGERQLLNRLAELRPSMAGAGRAATALDVGTRLGTDAIWKKALFIACEDTVLIFAPPRAGKSAWLGGQLIDAAGAAVATSTRADLYNLTHALRRKDGRPVWVFNSDLEGVPNTIRWNPVRGCEDPNVAIRRAGYLLAGSSSGDALTNQTFWDSHSFTLLRNLMMAAALMGGTLVDVARWVTDSNNQEPLRVLEANHHRVPENWYQTLRQELLAPDKTAAGVFMSLSPTLDFMSVPSIAQMVLPAAGEREFTAYELLATQGTLYMLGEDRDRGSIAPLYSCLVAEVYQEAKAWAKRAGGRIDPYVRFVLDEAAIICPLPLNKWTSDAGGWNIHMLISVQSYSQLEERWGVNGAKTIYTNCNKFALGGLSLPEDLERLSLLVGDADQTLVSVSKDRDGKPTESHSIRRIRVMPPKDVREMKPGHGLYFQRSGAPVKVTYLPTWKRKDVKEALRDEKRAAKLQRQQEKALVKQQQAAPVDLVKQQPVPVPVVPADAPVQWPVPQQPAARQADAYPVPPMPNYTPTVPAQQPAAAPAPVEAPVEAEQPMRRASGDGLLW